MVHVYCLLGQQVSSCSVECTVPFVSVPDHVEDTMDGLLWRCSPLNVYEPFGVGILLCWRQYGKAHGLFEIDAISQCTNVDTNGALWNRGSAMCPIWCCKQQWHAPTGYNRTHLAQKRRLTFLFEGCQLRFLQTMVHWNGKLLTSKAYVFLLVTKPFCSHHFR